MKYRHTCKGCSREFFGRRNKEFHDLQCKIEYNNEKATKLRQQLTDNKIMQKNHIILREAYSVYRNKAITLATLQRKGFETAAPWRRKKTATKGIEIFQSNGFGFRIIEESGKQFISIYTEEEINNL
jgi:hypothetical protein